MGRIGLRPDRDTTFIAGYGFDNPLNSDLAVYGLALRLPTRNICSTTALYLTAVRHIWGDLFLSFEWNHLMTKWTTGEQFRGGQLYDLNLVQLLAAVVSYRKESDNVKEDRANQTGYRNKQARVKPVRHVVTFSCKVPE